MSLWVTSQDKEDLVLVDKLTIAPIIDEKLKLKATKVYQDTIAKAYSFPTADAAIKEAEKLRAEIYDQSKENIPFMISCRDGILAIYSSKERAIRILESIKLLLPSPFSSNVIVFDMPSDTDVVLSEIEAVLSPSPTVV